MEAKTILGLKIKNYVEEDTSRGVFYSASLWLDDKEIGSLENPGDGSYTRIYIMEKRDREVFNEKMQAYFKQLGWDTSKQALYALDYTFAEHLISLFEEGKVDQDTLDFGFSV